MADVDLKVVEEKIKTGQALTKDELKEVMSQPPEGTSNILSPEDDIPDEDFHDEPPAKKAEDKKESADKKSETTDKKAEKTEKQGDDKDTDGDPMARLETELSKPEGKEDLTGWTANEKAYFWEMRRSRKRAQAAEAERDTIKFNAIKAKKADEKKEDVVEEDPLKDLKDEDAITGKELKKILASQKKSIKSTESAKQFDPESAVVTNLLKAQDDIARRDLGDDYDETVELTQEIVSNNPTYLRQIGEALMSGENVAKLTYTLIKGDPAYTKLLPVAQARLEAAGKGKKKEKKADEKKDDDEATKAALAAQEKLEKNTKKTKTSAHVDGSDKGTEEKFGEYTADQLTKMSDKEFFKVPKKVRDQFLKEVG